VQHGVKVVMADRPPREALCTNSLTPSTARHLGSSTRLFESAGWARGRVDLEGGLCVHPVVSAAQPRAFRAHGADMVGRKRLAQGAGYVGLDGLVGHLFDALVALLVFSASALSEFVNVLFLGVKGHLDLVDDFLKVLVELGVQHHADVLQGKALLDGRLAQPDPGDVALADVHDALHVVDQMVDLALDDRLEVGLELPAGDLDIDAEGCGRRLP